jgi:hypothetical protein
MNGSPQVTPSARAAILLVAATALAVVLPFVLMTRVFQPGSQGPASVTTPTSSDGAQGGSGLAGQSEQCKLANLRQRATLSAAEVSMAQFERHISAMSLLMAGKISLSVATTFWDQTRVEAIANAAAFRRADTELAASGATCPQLGRAAACSAPIEEVNAITTCRAAVEARDAALARARKAVTTWENQIHDMEMLRMGDITPAQAMAAWRKNWKLAHPQVVSYAAALKLADAKRCPLK